MLITRMSSFLYLVLFTACNHSSDETVSLPDKVDFNFHVKPILSDRCFFCHGPDKNKQEAGLALHEPESAYAALKNSPGHFAIVPHKPGKSELVNRILSQDPEYQMPPPSSNLSLTDYEKQILIKWIKQGAAYKPHWSFIPVKSPKLPKNRDESWATNPIDVFVKQKLEQEQIAPSPEADPATLIRRLSFDLRGLSPAIEEVGAFLANSEPDAYSKLVDRFLADPAYGERMAAHWLDVARYADSDGYLDDKHRDFSPWRDWVINAFNRNLSYQDFVTQQLAGDLLPDAGKEALLATAFNRLHKRNSEAGIVFEEFRTEYVADRTNTFGKAFLGLSFECARCHDHKYDPVSQEEYFKTFAFFNSTNEFGHAVYGPDQTPGPALLLTDEAVEAQLAFIEKSIKQQEQAISREMQQSAPAFEKWMEHPSASPGLIEKGLDRHLIAWYPFDKTQHPEGEWTESPAAKPGVRPARLKNARLLPGAKGSAYFADDYSEGKLAPNVGWFDRTDPFTIDLWLHPDTVYEEAGIFFHSEELRLGYKGYSLHLENNRPTFILAHSWPQNALQITAEQALPVRKWTKVTITYDGSSRAEGLKLYLNGEKAAVSVQQDHLYKGISFVPDIHTYGFNGFTFGQRDKVKLYKKGGLDEIRVFNTDLAPLEVLYLFDPQRAVPYLTGHNSDWLQPYFFARWHVPQGMLKDSLRELRIKANEAYNGIPEIMVMGDLPQPRPTFVLERGLYSSPGKAVEPGTPEVLLPFPKDGPANRLGLANWLFDRKNPLTARVFVNRIWQLHFGTGLVATSDDFGNQGELPSHPELLDWLANWFMENNWDIKALHKLILTSRTYRQSSNIRTDLQQRDPQNRLLARGPRFRLPAEMIRDNALAISGLLVEKQGGSSVYPYQPEGLWDELSNKHWRYKYLQTPGEGLYRRSIYTIWKRTSPPPVMTIFDVGDRDGCRVRRQTTSTPLQALVLLNDPQFIEAARATAHGVMQKPNLSVSAMLNEVFQLVTGRIPDNFENEKMQAYFETEQQRFQECREDAIAYLSIGEHKWDEALSVPDLAALGSVTAALMNTYEATIKH